MQAAYGIGAVEIGQGAGHPQGAMPGARRQAEPLGRPREQCAALGIGLGDSGQEHAVGVGVAARLRPAAGAVGQKAGRLIGFDGQELAFAIELGQALALDGTRGGDAGHNIGRAFGRWRQSEIGRAYRRDVDGKIDAVEQRT